MKLRAKAGLVIAGYVIALVLAAAAVACHLTALSGSSDPDNGGMSAFGDSLLFLAVFGVTAVPATGAAFFFLRPYPAFWRGFSVGALVFAVTSLAAFSAVAFDSRSLLASLAFLRILVAPLFALTFGLSIFFAPNRALRFALLFSTVIEVMGFACWLIMCLLRNH
jgi:hypothetical protein